MLFFAAGFGSIQESYRILSGCFFNSVQNPGFHVGIKWGQDFSPAFTGNTPAILFPYRFGP